jgi:hypothetical protein
LTGKGRVKRKGGAVSISMLFVCFGKPQTGPKLIEADGVTYAACGGAMWLTDYGNEKDPNTKSYDVVYIDAKGVRHELKRVRDLRVTDLASDSKACAGAQ